MNDNALYGYDQLVVWISQRYDVATYLRTLDSCFFARTTSTHGDCPLPRFELIDSPLDES